MSGFDTSAYNVANWKWICKIKILNSTFFWLFKMSWPRYNSKFPICSNLTNISGHEQFGLFQGQGQTQTRFAQSWTQYWWEILPFFQVIFICIKFRKSDILPPYWPEEKKTALWRWHWGSLDPPRKRIDHCKMNGVASTN